MLGNFGDLANKTLIDNITSWKNFGQKLDEYGNWLLGHNMDTSLIYEAYNVNPGFLNRSNISTLSKLNNYTELLNTRLSSSREVLSNAEVQNRDLSKSKDEGFIGKLVRTAANTKDQLGNMLSSVGSIFGREQQFAASFGAPFSYLEAVDPFGRVYKDLFGIRREETWINYKEGLLTDNNDSKTFNAYIKVGMISQAKGQGILDKIANTASQVKDKASGSADAALQLAQDRKVIEQFKNANPDKVKGKTEAQIKELMSSEGIKFKPLKPSIVTSFSLSFFINEDSLGATKNGYWDVGQCVPFNAFMINALTRGLMLTDQGNSGSNLGSAGNHTNHSAFNAENRLGIKAKLQTIFVNNQLPFFKFICSAETIVNETIQNQIGDSFIKGLLDKGSELSREISFISGGGDSVKFIQDMLGTLEASTNGFAQSVMGTIKNTATALTDSTQSFMESIFGKDMVDMILKGNSLIYPRVWKSSSIEKMCSLQMRFYSPYGDFESIYMNVLLPLFVILGFSLPRQVFPSFLSYPFCFSIEIPGLYQSNMAMVTNIAIKRGGNIQPPVYRNVS